MTCPQCHETAKFMQHRATNVHFLMGTGRHERPYYYCEHCGHGWFPTDEEMGIEHKQSPACREVVTLAGVVEPFASAAATLLPKLSGLNFSTSTVQTTTERVGAAVAAWRAAGTAVGPNTPWAWHPDANGQRVAYVSLDATSVLQQGPHAEKAEARMPWVGSVFNPLPMHRRKRGEANRDALDALHELLKSDPLVESVTAAIASATHANTTKSVQANTTKFVKANTHANGAKLKTAKAKPTETHGVPRSSAARAEARRTPHREWPTRYVCGVMSLEEIGRQLRAECVAVGVAHADVVVALTDGGNGLEWCAIETVLAGVARKIVPILDYFHAAEHLREFAKVWEPDESARQPLVTRWCHTLKHQGGEVLLKELEALPLAERSPLVADEHRKLTQYFRNNQHRMAYPTYIANGWQIGSGEIESACEHVVNRRLCSAGMRWRSPGITELCHLRALYRSEPPAWQHLWSRSTPG